MPWCHKCNAEYVEGVTACADCGGPLSDDPPPPPEETIFVEEESGAVDRGAFLATADSEEEASVMQALLSSAGIPSFLRHRSMDGYMRMYTGTSRFGVDVCVPSELLEAAIVLVEGEPGEPSGEPAKEPERREPERSGLSENTKMTLALIGTVLAAVLIIGGGVALVLMP